MPPKAAKSKEAPAERPILGRFSSHLKIGIVGLPNVGKSTLFNTLTKLSIPAENFPFCTIEPNEARVNIPDERFDWLCQLFKPKSEVSAFLEIHDIAGLVRGAHEGQGLGNNFLSHIRAVDGIFHVLRAFEDPDIIHVDDLVDPVRDLETISAELRLNSEGRFGSTTTITDIEFMERRIEDLEKSTKRSNDKQLKIEHELCLRVLSATLDEWNEEDIEAVIEVGGNASANSIYESYLPEGVSKPAHDAGHEERTQFIKSKYEQQAFLKPSLRIQAGAAAKNSSQPISSREIVNSQQSSSTSENSEFLGKMKVKVVKGSNLAVRDMLSSDPYVLLILGQQKVQTSVVNSNLNPVWNEVLTLSVPHDYSQIKLQVYDHDTFTADDIMGEADIDIQPIITSALAYGDAKKFADMQIGKWLKSYDNALIEDSPVNIVAGKVRQELWLRLQNVESGELELELEWVPL